MIIAIICLTALGFYLLGVLTAPRVRPYLDGIGQTTPTSTPSPLPKLRTEGVTQAVVESAPFTQETIQRVASGLRDKYIAAGVPVPKETELRDQAARALAGYDI